MYDLLCIIYCVKLIVYNLLSIIYCVSFIVFRLLCFVYCCEVDIHHIYPDGVLFVHSFNVSCINRSSLISILMVIYDVTNYVFRIKQK